MAKALKFFWGYGTGKGYEVANAGTASTSPAPHDASMTYSGSYNNITPTTADTTSWAPGTDWITFGSYWYFSGNDALRDGEFIDGRNASLLFSVTCLQTGEVRFRNFHPTTGEVYDSGSMHFTKDMWHRVEVKLKISAASDVRVYVDGVLALNLTGQDLSFGSGNFFLRLTNGTSSAAAVTYANDCGYIYTDTGANIDSESTIVGTFTVVGPYQNTANTTTAADFGAALATGDWENLSSIPFSDASLATYLDNSTKQGGVTCIGGSKNGPAGDARITGTILGAKWIWRVEGGEGMFGTHYFIPRYGAHTSESTDGTSAGSLYDLALGKQNIQVVVDSADAACPAANEYAQQGYGCPVGDSNTVTIYDMACFVLMKTPPPPVTQRRTSSPFGARIGSRQAV